MLADVVTPSPTHLLVTMNDSFRSSSTTTRSSRVEISVGIVDFVSDAAAAVETWCYFRSLYLWLQLLDVCMLIRTDFSR